ncbi:type VII secretion target [Streptomyces sp. NPDC058297]|uniref:type VII secretion target n=1 Tax=Streptomyces sp. NPDC058297 TaxID=3346433 RepID=UPI0036EFD328
MSDSKTGNGTSGNTVEGDDKLPEPPQTQLPISPDEAAKHHSPATAGLATAPPADSYRDPLEIQPLPTGDPLLPRPSPLLPPKGTPDPNGKDRLRIAPSILRKAAHHTDEVHEAFYKAAASLEGPALTAANGLSGWDSKLGITLAHKNWEKQAGTVTGWLAHIAASLRGSADSYHKTDGAVRDDLNQVRRPKSSLDGL